MLKSKISEVYFHKYFTIKIDSDDNLPLEKSLNIHFVILINYVFNINFHLYYCQLILEK